MTERISIDNKESIFSLTIWAFKDEAKQKMLLLWIILFSGCGIAIFTQFFGNYDSGTKIFFGVYIAFWLFFEFKVIYAYRWRKYGLEYITVEGDEIILTKQIGQRGLTQRYQKTEIENLRIFENADSNFVKSMTSSYWNINKYTLAFDFKGQIIPFGIDLTKKEAHFVLKQLKEQLKDS